jgi:hypothetical protein
VPTSNHGAELGSQAGGAVNIVTKPGTNQFHGKAFAYHRNAVRDARYFFSPVKDQLKRTQFGERSAGRPCDLHRHGFLVFSRKQALPQMPGLA